MKDTVVVLMLRDNKTGFLEKEIAQYKILENENLIVNLFGEKSDDEINIHMKITTDRDVEDWEFSAVYDYYNEEVFNDIVKSIEAEEDCYNPTWEVVFLYDDNELIVEEKINKILEIHINELSEVYSVIKDKKEEYCE